MKFSIRSLIVLSLILFLIVVSIYERNRADQLANRLEQLESPLVEAVKEQEWLVQKKQLALDYSKSSFRANTDPAVLKQLSQLKLPTVEPGVLTLSVGIRRELANIRNAELKLSREKSKLAALQNALDEPRSSIDE